MGNGGSGRNVASTRFSLSQALRFRKGRYRKPGFRESPLAEAQPVSVLCSIMRNVRCLATQDKVDFRE
jgi:hypothetical protein